MLQAWTLSLYHQATTLSRRTRPPYRTRSPPGSSSICTTQGSHAALHLLGSAPPGLGSAPPGGLWEHPAPACSCSGHLPAPGAAAPARRGALPAGAEGLLGCRSWSWAGRSGLILVTGCQLFVAGGAKACRGWGFVGNKSPTYSKEGKEPLKCTHPNPPLKSLQSNLSLARR